MLRARQAICADRHVVSITIGRNGGTRIARDQPLSVTGRGLSLLVGGPDDELELYDLASDDGEQHNIALERPDEAVALLSDALAELLACGASDELLAPRREALAHFRRAANLG